MHRKAIWRVAKCALALVTFTIAAYSATPVLFYSDLDSGPNTGGQNNKGAFVCVYGQNFGSSQGGSAITVGGGPVDNYPFWGASGNPAAPDKACFQLGASAATGNIVMTTSAGTSNGLPFTVRAGNIYFVATNGSDTSNGSYASPWASIKKCKNTIAAGDTCYVENGVTETTKDTWGFVSLTSSGSSGHPKTIAAYPGATVTVGQVESSQDGYGSIVAYAGTGAVTNWTIAGLNVIGGDQMAFQNSTSTSSFFRLVANKFQCPQGWNEVGCVSFSFASNVEFLGNELTNVGCGAGHTGGLDDGTGDSGQALQNPCWATAGSGTVSSANGTTITASTYGVFLMQVGDHIILNLGNGPEEKIVTSITATSSGPNPDSLTVNASFSKPSFNGASWTWRPSNSGKLYHVFYGSTNFDDSEVGWNYIHNNSAVHGLNFHSSPRTYSGISAVSAGTPVQITLATPEPSITNGQRVDIPVASGIKPSQTITCNAAATGTLYVQVVNSTHMNLYKDAGLTTPVPGTTACSGGSALAYFDGFDLYGVSIHNNYIHHQNGSGISLGSNDPGSGAIKIYNNILYNIGCGPNESEFYPFVGMFFPGYHESGQLGSGNLQIYNNTLYNIGNWTGQYFGSYYGDVFQNDPSIGITLINNVFLQTGKEYVDMLPGAAAITGSNNLAYGGTGTLPGVTGTLTTDPQFVSTTTPDFHLQSSSPAANAALGSALPAADFDGLSRPQTANGALGAYELASGAAVTQTANPCDLNGDGVVNQADVQLAIEQTIGEVACSNLAALGAGSCNVSGIQRVINAMQGACVLP